MKNVYSMSLMPLIISFAGCATLSSDQRKLDEQLRNKQAPDFELVALDGQTVKLSEFHGRPVVLAFFGYG